MTLLVTGSIGIDTVTTPYGTSQECIGGSSVYFSMAASFFSPVRFLGVTGPDCPFDLHDVFAGRSVDLQGLEVRQGSKTFRWKGSYTGDMNEASTDDLQLNVLAEAPPALPDAYKDSKYIFLANTNPQLQMQLIEQLDSPQFIVADTMNCWISRAREDLVKLLGRINGLVINEGEAKMLTSNDNLVAAAKEILNMASLDFVIVKKGEHGTLLWTRQQECFVLPAWPTDAVKDPTGAGDSFAGGMMGYIAQQEKTDLLTMKKAIAYGTCTASLVIEDFSINRWSSAGMEQIEQRLMGLKQITQF